MSHDLAELGIKALDPSVFASADYAHVGTSQLQHSMLKIALLLGVQVRPRSLQQSLNTLLEACPT